MGGGGGGGGGGGAMEDIFDLKAANGTFLRQFKSYVTIA